MTWTTILDRGAALGGAALDSFWVPLLAWTVLALPVWWAIRRTDRIHPHGKYRLLQLVLAALPIGLLAASLGQLVPVSTKLPALKAPAVAVLSPVQSVEVAAAAPPTWEWIHLVGFFTGVAIILALVRLGHLGLHGLAALRVKSTVDRDGHTELNRKVARLAETLRIRRPVEVTVQEKAEVPMTLGGLRPTILLPPRLTRERDALRTTLVHECVHIRRWDDLAYLAERLVGAVFFIHPLVSRLSRDIQQARERACDAAVLDDGQVSPASYARLLTAFADGTVAHRLGALSLSESPSSLTDRIQAMRAPISNRLSSRLGLALALTIVGGALTLGVVACSDTVGPSALDSPSSTAATDTTYMVVEDQPELIGGMKALQESVTYPESAREAGAEGRVIVQFVVNKDGDIEKPTVVKGVNETLNRAALIAVMQQEFKPGRQDGAPVRVQMSLPVTFRLGDDPPPESKAAAERSRQDGTAGRDETFVVVEDSPELQGGMKALQAAVEYPEMAREAGIEGRVIVQFVVNEDGEVENPKVVRGVHEALNQAALDAVRAQQFEPGRQNGAPARVQMSLPVTFRLSSAPSETKKSANTSKRSVSLEVTDLDVTNDRISGRVIDSETDMPVRAANVRLPSLEVGAASGSDGYFSVDVPSAMPSRLVVSHPNHGQQSIELRRERSTDRAETASNPTT